LITLEGGEGAGKSTQAKRLLDRLAQVSIAAIATREPGGSPGAEAIRGLLVSGAADRWSATTETLLMYAARADHLERTIRPALAQGLWVVCDRFADSTRAYQGAAGGAPEGLIAGIESAVVGEDKPDLTLIFDLAPEAGLARAQGRGGAEDRFEGKGLAFHQRLRERFLSIAKAEPDRCVVIDAGAEIEAVAEAVWTAVNRRLL
jgi:dTMP kinase